MLPPYYSDSLAPLPIRIISHRFLLLCVRVKCTRDTAFFHSDIYLFILLFLLLLLLMPTDRPAIAMVMCAVSHICPLRSLLVQRLLIACLKMIIIVDAIKHFVIKCISHRYFGQAQPIYRLAFKSVKSVFLFFFSFLFCFLAFRFVFFIGIFSVVLFCYKMFLLRKSLLVIIYNLQNTRSLWPAVCRILMAIAYVLRFTVCAQCTLCTAHRANRGVLQR